MANMIRVIRPDGTVYECDTEQDFQIYQRVLGNGHVESKGPRAAPASTQGATARLTLEDGPRRALTALLSAARIEGEELRHKLDMDSEELGKTLLVLSNRLQHATGKRLDEYVKRTRTFKNGQRIKVYQRTKAGEKLKTSFDAAA